CRVAGLLDLGQDVLNQLLEVVGARDEVRLAVDLDEDAARVILGDAIADQALAGRPAGLFGRRREAAFAEDRDRLVEVAVRLGEGGLAFHHARAGRVAELLYVSSRNRHGIESFGDLMIRRSEITKPRDRRMEKSERRPLGRRRSGFAGTARRARRRLAVVAAGFAVVAARFGVRRFLHAAA